MDRPTHGDWIRNSCCSGPRLLAHSVYFLNLLFSYTLMLVVMSYNVGYGVAVIVGSGLGFFFFQSYRKVEVDDEPTVDCCEVAE